MDLFNEYHRLYNEINVAKKRISEIKKSIDPIVSELMIYYERDFIIKKKSKSIIVIDGGETIKSHYVKKLDELGLKYSFQSHEWTDEPSFSMIVNWK
jgi:transposase